MDCCSPFLQGLYSLFPSSDSGRIAPTEMFTLAHYSGKKGGGAEQVPANYLANPLRSEQYWALPFSRRLHDVGVKTKELTAKQTLAVRCTTCGAAAGEVCELHNGAPRTESHRDRKLAAAEAVEKKRRNR
jgi:hypothetical protein